jgi:hypothetical protein
VPVEPISLDFSRTRKDPVSVERSKASVMATYHGGKQTIILFKGTATPFPKADPTDPRISYICTFQAGDAR